MALKFLRALMPREERFVDNFAAHAGRMVAAAQALEAMMRADAPERDTHFKAVCTIEGEADAIARDTLISLHKAFITPFDRSDIHALSTALDDAIDLIEEVAQRAVLYRLDTFSPRMLELVAMIEQAAKLLADAIPLLHDVNRNISAINALCEKVGRIESDADRLLRQALSELIAQRPDPIEFFGRKEVYELLETVTDRCDDVADLIEGILLDHV